MYFSCRNYSDFPESGFHFSNYHCLEIVIKITNRDITMSQAEIYFLTFVAHTTSS
jgi:hypothetical protein